MLTESFRRRCYKYDGFSLYFQKLNYVDSGGFYKFLRRYDKYPEVQEKAQKENRPRRWAESASRL